jgi:MFS family permease
MAVGALLVGVMMASGLIQYALSALGPVLARDLDLSVTSVGALSSVYFTAATVGSSPLGRWVSRHGSRAGLLLTVTMAVLGALVCTAAPAYAVLLLGVGCAGLAAAAANPATNLALSHVAQPHGLLVGLKQSGVAVAALGAGVVLPSVAEHVGWRASFLVCAVVAAAMVPVTARRPRVAPSRRRRDQAGRSPSAVRVLTAFSFFMGAALSTVTAYLPLYAHQTVQLGIGRSGAIVAVIGACGIVGRIAVSVAAGRMPVSAMPRLLAGVAVCSLLGLTFVVAAAREGEVPLWLGVLLLGLAGSGWNGAVMLTVLRVSPDVGRASGFVQTGFFSGLAIMPVVFGRVVDWTGDFVWGWSITGLSLLSAVGVAALVLPRFVATSVPRSIAPGNR